MTKPIGIGLIGLGRHGLRYARHLLELPLPGARLVAVCRRDAEQGRRFASDHSLHFHRDYPDLIADPAVQAVIVVTPPSLNKPICLQAVRAGKPLLIEKPLAVTAADAADMVTAAEKAGVPIMTAQTMRYDPAVQALKAELPAAGSRRYLALTNRTDPRPDIFHDPRDYGGRGVLLEIGVHQIDLMRYLTGEEIADVRCEMDHRASGGPELRALATLRTTSGFPCMLDVSRVSAGRVGRAEWITDAGQLIVDFYGHRLSRVKSRTDVDEWTVEDRPTLLDVLQGFLTSLERGLPMPITGRDGLRAVEIVEACYRSAAEDRTVRVVPAA
jgi:predicted dehydrogenase